MTQRTPSRASERLQEMYLELRDRICQLAYPPGARLKETVLASEFGVIPSSIEGDSFRGFPNGKKSEPAFPR